MITRAEDLPAELWFEILDYLRADQIFESFLNVNKYFNDIIFSRLLLFKIELKSDDNYQNIEHLPDLYRSSSLLNRTICLKSSIKYRYDYFPEFYQNHSDKLINLQSFLIKANRREIPSVIGILSQHPTLTYLSLSCIPNDQLLESILRCSSLRKCHLDFWRITAPVQLRLNSTSYIETLSIKLNNDVNHSIMNLFLPNLTNLKKLDIFQENLINETAHPLFRQISNIEQLKLAWGCHPIRSNTLKDLLDYNHNLKHLVLKIYYSIIDEIFTEQLLEFFLFISKKNIRIKIVLRCHRLGNRIEGNLRSEFKNYNEQILKMVQNQSNLQLKISVIEESLKISQIELNFTK